MDTFVNLMNTGVYYQGEEGQFRSPEERKCFIELFCYPVSIFDFGPDKKGMPKEIFQFIQARALMKTAAWMGIPFEEITSPVLGFYALVIDNSKIDHRLKFIADILNSTRTFYDNCLK